MNIDIGGTDAMVAEYLICKLTSMYIFFYLFITTHHNMSVDSHYIHLNACIRNHHFYVLSIDRGFTQTFQILEAEKKMDRTKGFEITKLVEVVILVVNTIYIIYLYNLCISLYSNSKFYLSSSSLQ